MQTGGKTVGVIGLGKIGAPMAENLLKSGYRVVGYRRSATPDLEAKGMVRAANAAEVGAAADVVLSCIGSPEALDETVSGPNGLASTARPGQIVVELGSYKIPEKERQIAPLAAKGAKFLDGEVSGTPPMVAARKAAVFLAGDEAAAKVVEPVMKGFADNYYYFGPFGAATKVKLINNLLVAVHIAAAAEAVSLGLAAGVDVATMIQAIANGSGGSSSFAARAQWMAEHKYAPVMGTPELLQHYVFEARQMAEGLGRATPMLDKAAELYAKALRQGLGQRDVAVMIKVLEELPAEEKPARRKGFPWFGRPS